MNDTSVRHTESIQAEGTDIQLYVYTAFVTSVYDGDTITCTIDCGFNVKLHGRKIRLHGIDTPELRGVERTDGLRVRDLLREKILGKKIVLRTIRDRTGKYGRYIGVVYVDGENVNEWLLREGHATEYS